MEQPALFDVLELVGFIVESRRPGEKFRKVSRAFSFPSSAHAFLTLWQKTYPDEEAHVREIRKAKRKPK
jgi:hypothetical protein